MALEMRGNPCCDFVAEFGIMCSCWQRKENRTGGGCEARMTLAIYKNLEELFVAET